MKLLAFFTIISSINASGHFLLQDHSIRPTAKQNLCIRAGPKRGQRLRYGTCSLGRNNILPPLFRWSYNEATKQIKVDGRPLCWEASLTSTYGMLYMRKCDTAKKYQRFTMNANGYITVANNETPLKCVYIVKRAKKTFVSFGNCPFSSFKHSCGLKGIATSTNLCVIPSSALTEKEIYTTECKNNKDDKKFFWTPQEDHFPIKLEGDGNVCLAAHYNKKKITIYTAACDDTKPNQDFFQNSKGLIKRKKDNQRNFCMYISKGKLRYGFCPTAQFGLFCNL